MSDHYGRYNGMENLLGTDAISRQAAIDALKGCYCGGEDSCGEPWIYEDNAIKAVEQLPPTDPTEHCERCMMEHMDNMEKLEVELAQAKMQLPPAQPEIIRCRECKFASGDSRICMKFGHSPIGELDFCAWAERRTDG